MSSTHLYPLARNLMSYPYTAKYANKLKYWDQSPLCIILYTDQTHFIGANVHYLEPRLREMVVERASHGELLFPKSIIHKYLQSNAAIFESYDQSEWKFRVKVTRGSFVDKNGRPVKPEVVWSDPKISAHGVFHAVSMDLTTDPYSARTYFGDSLD